MESRLEFTGNGKVMMVVESAAIKGIVRESSVVIDSCVS
jgi:hypothetical protein